MILLTVLVTPLLFVYLLAALLRPDGSRRKARSPCGLLPMLILAVLVALSIPLGRYMARVLDRRGAGNAVERSIDTGPQIWKQYCFAMLLFNVSCCSSGSPFSRRSLHPAFQPGRQGDAFADHDLQHGVARS